MAGKMILSPRTTAAYKVTNNAPTTMSSFKDLATRNTVVSSHELTVCIPNVFASAAQSFRQEPPCSTANRRRRRQSNIIETMMITVAPTQ